MMGNNLKLLEPRMGSLLPPVVLGGNSQGADEHVVSIECGQAFPAVRAVLPKLILLACHKPIQQIVLTLILSYVMTGTTVVHEQLIGPGYACVNNRASQQRVDVSVRAAEVHDTFRNHRRRKD